MGSLLSALRTLGTNHAKTFDLQRLAFFSATEYEYDTITINESPAFVDSFPHQQKDFPSDTVESLRIVVGQFRLAVYTLNESRHAPFEVFAN